MIPRSLATIIVALTTIVWLANFFAPFVIKDFKPDPAINGIYLAIIGGALALSRGGKGGGGNGSGGGSGGGGISGAIQGFLGHPQQAPPPDTPGPAGDSTPGGTP